jgi:hypothetical protein
MRNILHGTIMGPRCPCLINDMNRHVFVFVVLLTKVGDGGFVLSIPAFGSKSRNNTLDVIGGCCSSSGRRDSY